MAHVNCIVTRPENDGLEELVQSFWVQENTAIVPEKETALSVEDHLFLDKLEKETYLGGDGHYVVPMLWDPKVRTLPNNLALTKKRFQFLRRRLRNNPEMYSLYNDQILDYIAKGYARRLSDEEAAVVSDKTWTIPHHPVVNPNKPGQIRVVKDAAAIFEGTSLNESLKTGPDLLNSLIGIILRFRTGRVAITVDITAMFHQVRVPREDSDSLRFLWTNDINSDKEPYVGEGAPSLCIRTAF